MTKSPKNYRTEEAVAVRNAKHIGGYKLDILFSDGSTNTVDFENYLFHRERAYIEYRDPKNFLKFKVANGNLVWGKDWDIIFPIEKLYSPNGLQNIMQEPEEPYMRVKVG